VWPPSFLWPKTFACLEECHLQTVPSQEEGFKTQAAEVDGGGHLMAKIAKKGKRLVLGKDFDAWVWHWAGERCTALEHLIRIQKDEPSDYPVNDGKWVRVKFVKVP